MTNFFKTATMALLLGGTAAPTFAETLTAGMKTHPSQGDVTPVQGAGARISRDADGMFVSVETTGLTPGNVHTLWFVVINDPASCETEPCTGKDVLKRSDIVQSDVGYAGGVIVGDDGAARFAWRQDEGPLSGGWFGAGLANVAGSEIHLVINDHGPVIEGRTAEMLGTYRDGCRDDSIPAPMPATARVQGEPGPNTCRLMQFTIFAPEVPSS